MTTPSPQRYAPIPAEAMNDEQKAVAELLVNGPRGGIRGPFNALLRNPTLANRVRQLGDSIRFENSLAPADREFIILMTARFWTARYEWYAHGKIALELGVPQATIDAIANRQKPDGMTGNQPLLWQFCHEMLEDKDVSDATYAQAVGRFGEKTVLDIMATSGYFGFVSVILNTIRAPVPADARPLSA